MRHRIIDISDKELYAAMRTKYANFLVGYLEQLKSKIIKDYKQKGSFLHNSDLLAIFVFKKRFPYSVKKPSDIQDVKLRNELIEKLEQNKKNYLTEDEQNTLRWHVEYLGKRIGVIGVIGSGRTPLSAINLAG